MIIKIEQTLHGYEVGHQLLMSSTPLSSDAKQTLLVQSDLSGSNIDEYFKSYVTGYPIGNYYAFSKTWYADEMPRPGCVWTQTLLIAFPDLGKIPDLNELRKLFKRPIRDQYQLYAEQLTLDIVSAKNENIFDRTIVESALLVALYEQPEKTIFLPVVQPAEAEDALLNIWSNQWPRLRRNFLFCSGALGVKMLDRREFDLQIIPKRNAVSIELQSSNGYIVEPVLPIDRDWIELLYSNSKESLRRFLWVYGSDVEGVRKNYKPLIQLYGESLKRDPKIDFTANLVSESFKGLKEGVKLKSSLLGNNTLFNFKPNEVLNFLFSSGADFNDRISKEALADLLVRAYQAKQITIKDFVNYYLKSDGQLPASIWSTIVAEPLAILELVIHEPRLLNVFSDQIRILASHKELWQSSNSLQHQALQILESIDDINWEQIIIAMLKARSDIIISALQNDKRRSKILFKWFNIDGYNLSTYLNQRLVQNYKTEFTGFLRENFNILGSQTCETIFQQLNFGEIATIGFDAGSWLVVYRKTKNEPTKIFASCVLLSLGFNRKVGNPAALVSGCFADVYYFAKDAKVTGNEWQMLPIDMSEEDDDDDFLKNLFTYLNLFSPKKSDVPNWDYCELLLRTLVNKFIKNSWPRRALLECLSTKELTEQFIRYSLSFKKGAKLLREVLNDIEKRKIIPLMHQKILLDDIKNRVNWSLS